MRFLIQIAWPCILTYLALCATAVRVRDVEIEDESLVTVPNQFGNNEVSTDADSSANTDVSPNEAVDAPSQTSSNDGNDGDADGSDDSGAPAVAPSSVSGSSVPSFICSERQRENPLEAPSGTVGICSPTSLALGRWGVSFGNFPTTPKPSESTTASGACSDGEIGETTKFLVRHYRHTEDTPVVSEETSASSSGPSTADPYSLGLFIVATGPCATKDVLEKMTQYADETIKFAMKGKPGASSVKSDGDSITRAINVLLRRLVDLFTPNEITTSQVTVGILVHDLLSDRVYKAGLGHPVILVKPRADVPIEKPRTIWLTRYEKPPPETMQELFEDAGFVGFKLQAVKNAEKPGECFLFTLRKALEMPTLPQQLVSLPKSKRQLQAILNVSNRNTHWSPNVNRVGSYVPWGGLRGSYVSVSERADGIPARRRHSTSVTFNPLSIFGQRGTQNRSRRPYKKARRRAFGRRPSARRQSRGAFFLRDNLRHFMAPFKQLDEFFKEFANIPPGAWELKHSMQIQLDFCELAKAEGKEEAPAQQTANAATAAMKGIVFGADAAQRDSDPTIRYANHIVSIPRVDIIEHASAAIDYVVFANYALIYPYWKHAHQQVYTERQVAEDKTFTEAAEKMVQPWINGNLNLRLSPKILEKLTELETASMDRCIANMYRTFAPFTDDATAWETSGQRLAEEAYALRQALKEDETTGPSPRVDMKSVKAMFVKFSLGSVGSQQQ